ncbi:MAG: hypothetical protein U9P80_01165 [Thermodesulfobacteriota bacterium]|nr:hypothetical protein [Thermodesulfobacteriota bacterium]
MRTDSTAFGVFYRRTRQGSGDNRLENKNPLNPGRNPEGFSKAKHKEFFRDLGIKSNN